MKVAVCITTRNRPEAYKKTFHKIALHSPPEFEIIVVDDASDKRPLPLGDKNYRFPVRVGIPRAKNKCLELAYNWGADHVFLFDDDTYPISDDWWVPYVESKEPHLMYIFTGFGNQTRGIKEIYRDKNVVAYDHVRGCMLYLERRVIDTVGGFDTDFGIGQYEHTNLTDRIFNNGLTTFRVMDVPDSNKLIYSMDEHQEVTSTLDSENRRLLMRTNRRLKDLKNNKEYKPFK